MTGPRLDIVSLVAVFVYGTERRRSERIEKTRMLRESPERESS